MGKIAAICAIALTLATAAQAKEPFKWPQLGVETSIPFADHHGINDFEADRDDGVWLEDQQRRWYYAELAGTCLDLDFVQTIGYESRGSTRFDRFGSLVVRGQRCPLVSLVTAEKPLPRKERQKLRDDVRAAGKAAVAAPPTN